MSKFKIKLNMDDLTFGELEIFEEVTGLVMSDAVKQEVVRGKDGRPIPDPENQGRPLKEVKMSVKAMMGLVYVAVRRENPDVTFDDIRRMKMSDVDLDIEENVDPTNLPDESVEAEESVTVTDSDSNEHEG
jgi:hypothetical protein